MAFIVPTNPPRRDPTRARSALVWVLTVLVVGGLGYPLGLLWGHLAPRVAVLKLDQGLVYADTEPEQAVAADGWFLLLGIGAGLLITIAAWLLLRRYRGAGMLVALVLGSLLSAWLAWWVGRQVGLATFEHLRATAAVGTTFDAPLRLRVTDQRISQPWAPRLDGVLAAQAMAAAFVYTCCAGWSRFSSLRGPDPAGPVVPPVPPHELPGPGQGQALPERPEEGV